MIAFKIFCFYQYQYYGKVLNLKSSKDELVTILDSLVTTSLAVYPIHFSQEDDIEVTL